MFNFHKYIAGLSILGISIQSIFGYGMLAITTGVVIQKVTPSPKIVTAAGTATQLGDPICEDFTSYYAKINYYKEDNTDTGILLHEARSIPGITTGTGTFQGYF